MGVVGLGMTYLLVPTQVSWKTGQGIGARRGTWCLEQVGTHSQSILNTYKKGRMTLPMLY
jgi:hypothetical protein